MSSRVCGLRTEVYSRVVGYIRPVGQWNPGKASEYSERVDFVPDRTVDVDGEVVADVFAALMGHIKGHKGPHLHTEADWLRTNGHELAGELLEMLATARDEIMVR